MAAQKPSVPKGTRDFSPVEMVKRNFIFDSIKDVFKRYGYLPIETPSMENLSTLLGKYGDEGDKLIFRILDSGDFIREKGEQIINEVINNSGSVSGSTSSSISFSDKLRGEISEKGLRYDLTVPFARFVVQHLNEITFPFKRYQIQPVWRADRPQKGRYREFYQCDVDVIGSNSLLNEVELIQIIDDVFKKLNVNVVIKLNNRKILAGIAEIIGEPDKIIDITIAIDKLEKIGKKGVYDELLERGVSSGSVSLLDPILELKADNISKLLSLKEILKNSEIGLKGITEVETILAYLDSLNLKTEIELDLTLARGLNYYTGAIIEVKATDVEIGSICGGGRYDDLTGVFGLKDVSGVGVSFGADRIYDVLEQLKNFPQEIVSSTKVLFVNFGVSEEKYLLPFVKALRDKGIATEIYPESAKMKKQMSYADNKNIPFVVIVGETERSKGIFTVKNMKTGDQAEMTFDELTSQLS